MATEHIQPHGTDGHHAGDEHHGHSPYLHHHFETPVQQFESDKLGMWLFLATEILMFGGLFCAYSVYRHNHPEVFVYAHQFLDKTLGATNTVVLILSSFTMAWSIRAIQQGKKLLCAALLVVTLICAATFMVIKYFEYTAKIEHGLLWGYKYHPHHEGEGAEHGEGEGADHGAAGAGAEHGAADESAEHGAAVAEGEKHADTSSASPAAGTADSTAEKHTAMPIEADAALGESEDPGATQISDQDVASATKKAAEGADSHAPLAQPVADKANEPSTVGPPGVVTAPVPADFTFPSGVKLEPSKIKSAALPPGGLNEAGAPKADHGPEPKNVQTFFAIYFAMTGLHGIHVLAGMIAITIMLVFVLKGKYNKDYWTPIDLTGLFWHVVDLIWIFLFPLLYLIAEN